jgi:hypothetical protein
MTNDRPDLSSEVAPVIDKTILVNVNRNKYQVVRPSWALKPGLTDRMVVGRKVTLTLTDLVSWGIQLREKGSLRRIVGSAGGPGPSREETRPRGKTVVKCTVLNCKVYTVIQ